MGTFMPLSEAILIIMGFLSVAMVATGIARNFPIPYTVLLVILGIILGTLSRSTEVLQPLMEFQLTSDVVLFLFLPALIFESAFNLNARQLVKDLFPILILAIPALITSTALIGAGLWLFLGIDLTLALLFGALISATDPTTVLSLFKELGAPERLTTLVEGESLLNDATAIVIFGIILLFVLNDVSPGWIDASGAIITFFEVFIGGVLVGAIIGFVLSEVLYKLFPSLNAFMIMTLVTAYSCFIIADHILHVSGVMAVVASAITMGLLWVPRISQDDIHTAKDLWGVIALTGNSLLFLFVGLSVDVWELIARIDMIALAVLLVLLARAATIYTLVPVAITWFSLPKISRGEQHVMWWGGFKGGLAIAIALSIPETLAERGLLIDLTLGVVMFSLLINAPTIRPLMKKFGVDKLTDDEHAELKEGMVYAGKKSHDFIHKFYESKVISRSVEQLVKKNVNKVFGANKLDIREVQGARHLRLNAVKAEFDELKKLYDMHLIKHYTYLEIRNDIQRDMEMIIANQASKELEGGISEKNLFLNAEKVLLCKLREHDWAIWLLHRYQNIRLSNKIQCDVAQIIICTSIIKMIEKHIEFSVNERTQVADKYRSRLEKSCARLREIADDFPDFYAKFEASFFTCIALTSAQYYAAQKHRNGGLSAKVFNRMDKQIRSEMPEISPTVDLLSEFEISDLINSVPLINGLSSAVCNHLAKCAVPVTFLAGDIVIGEGEHGDALYIIKQGIVSVYKDDKEINTLRAGDFFGEMALLDDQIRTATVKAKTPSTLLRLKRRNVIQLAKEDAELKNRLSSRKEGRQKQVEMIRSVPMLKGLSNKTLSLIVAQTKLIKFSNPGDIIFKEGDSGESLFIIFHGVVDVYKSDRQITELTRGSFFGEMALLGDHVRTATIRVKEAAALLELSETDINELAGTCPELRQKLVEAKRSREILI